MPNQRYESHHRICNLRYGTHGYGMDAYEGMAKITGGMGGLGGLPF